MLGFFLLWFPSFTTFEWKKEFFFSLSYLSWYDSWKCIFDLFSFIQEVTQETIDKYVALDNKIRLLENKNIRKTYDSVKKRYDAIVLSVQTLKKKYEECKKQT